VFESSLFYERDRTFHQQASDTAPGQFWLNVHANKLGIELAIWQLESRDTYRADHCSIDQRDKRRVIRSSGCLCDLTFCPRHVFVKSTRINPVL
jgi:hypothetical protein